MTDALTPGELLAHEAEFAKLLRPFLKNVATRAGQATAPTTANDLLHKLDHLESMRLAAKPAGEGVREATIEECAKIADKVSAALSEFSKRAEAAGETQTMYRANTAWHNTTGIAEMIRALSTTKAPKP